MKNGEGGTEKVVPLSWEAKTPMTWYLALSGGNGGDQSTDAELISFLRGVDFKNREERNDEERWTSRRRLQSQPSTSSKSTTKKVKI